MQKVLPGSHQSSINIYKFTVVIQLLKKINPILLRRQIIYGLKIYHHKVYHTYVSSSIMTINSRLPTAGYQDIPLQKKFIRITRRVRTIRIVTAPEIHVSGLSERQPDATQSFSWTFLHWRKLVQNCHPRSAYPLRLAERRALPRREGQSYGVDI